MGEGDPAIRVQGLHKTFRSHRSRPETLKERVVHPGRSAVIEEHRVLEDISFEVSRGEFFGITGRNGSGKSTLLRVIAGIYGADSGRVQTAGRIAPLIELGVGFHPELKARDNIVLNGAMMGIAPAAADPEQVIAFAGLTGHEDLRLKNYSSGMRVRLGFSILMHADADVLLLDEILAVGDSAFQRQCEASFELLIDAGKTIVLVTHSMGRVKRFCDRALVLEGGRVDAIGEPDAIAARYAELTAKHRAIGRGAAAAQDTGEAPATAALDGWLAADKPQATPMEDVRGPTALGVSPDRFWQLLWLMARTEFKLRYQGSLLGYAWSVASPLLLFGVLYLVFNQIIRFGEGVEGYPVMLLLNIMLFRFFSESTQSSVSSVVTREALVRKSRFPRSVIPLAVVLTAAIGLCLNLVVVFGYVLLYGVEPSATWLLLPVILTLLLALTVGASLLLSSLYVRYRDVAQIWTVLSLALFYLTPVLFPIEIAPEGIQDVLVINPLAPLLIEARQWIIDPQAPGVLEVAGAWGIVGPALAGIAICALGVLSFQREAQRAAEDL